MLQQERWVSLPKCGVANRALGLKGCLLQLSRWAVPCPSSCARGISK